MALPPPAGVKMGISDWINFILTMVKMIPALISNRSSVVDERLAKVLAAFYILQQWINVEQFIHTIQEEKKYTKIGAVGCVVLIWPGLSIDRLSLHLGIALEVPLPFGLDQKTLFTALLCAILVHSRCFKRRL
jgi:hypothetical protein